jgi:hypothetical protein
MTYLALNFRQQPLSILCALRIMPAYIRILDDLHLLPHFVPASLNQHSAQPPRIATRQKGIQIEIQKVAIRQSL